MLYVQRKAVNYQRVAVENVNWKIRNHANGFIFALNNEDPIPEDVTYQAIQCANSIQGLDFCSVDVLWNKRQGKAYVIEVNTASGLTNTSVEHYSNAFREYVEDLRNNVV